MKIRNTFIIFLVSGFWHGANWTFIIWGGLNALFFLPLLIAEKNRHNLEVVAMGKIIPSFREVFNILMTFALTCFAWIFFRAASVSDAIGYIKGIFSQSLFSFPTSFNPVLFGLILFMLGMEWANRTQDYGLKIQEKKPIMKAVIYIVVAYLVLNYANFGSNEFIYFQF